MAKSVREKKMKATSKKPRSPEYVAKEFRWVSNVGTAFARVRMGANAAVTTGITLMYPLKKAANAPNRFG